MQEFVPSAETSRAFRDALGRFATGVTVVTCATPEGPMAIVANSFASVSLDPPLVLWSPARAGRRFPAFAAAQHFAIHVLSADQRALCDHCARNGQDFDGSGWAPSAEGTPLLPDCLARFECAMHAQHEGGDHLIIVGRVLRVSQRDGAPLLFASGQYGQFAKTD